ncbi:MAG: hypothetical protein H0X40_15215 [Chthoniobacterales bacterium]|nr:hypothetical protein [Chthoniobacterales bacterium]
MSRQLWLPRSRAALSPILRRLTSKARCVAAEAAGLSKVKVTNESVRSSRG